MSQFYLYTTLGCHLCEQAESLIKTQEAALGFSWQAKEIADQDHLVELYGVKIPVLHCCTTQLELSWPFDEDELLEWLQIQLSHSHTHIATDH